MNVAILLMVALYVAAHLGIVALIGWIRWQQTKEAP